MSFLKLISLVSWGNAYLQAGIMFFIFLVLIIALIIFMRGGKK